MPFAGVLVLCLGMGWMGTSGRAATSLQVLMPVEYQVIQRDSPTQGTIPVRGILATDGKPPDLVEVRWVGATTHSEWQTARSRGGTSFVAALSAPAGGWYRVEVRARDADQVVAEGAVARVGIGDVFVISGQSNSANYGEERLKSESGMVSAFDGRGWQLASDPQPGATGGGGSYVPPLGDALAKRWQVPIGFVATGVGATSVREWLPAGIQFTNPPTLTGNVRQLPSGLWESKGDLFQRLIAPMKALGPRGFRAVLWHQGESDANQADTTRTLVGAHYRRFLERLIQESRREAGWEIPWMVALVSYHTPQDTGSADIRSAQKSLWDAGIAIEGPDSDALVGDHRDGGGKGVHFSGKGQREHASRWAQKVTAWLESQPGYGIASQPKAAAKPQAPPGKLVLPGYEAFKVADRPAFVFLPPESLRKQPQPWVFYAPTLPGYPDEAERWMHEQFLAAGVAVAGVDVGEAYGSPSSHAAFDALYQELTQKRGFARKPCLFGRSRGGLWVSSWAIANPSRTAGLIGIYPVYDFRTYPGIEKAASAYGLTVDELRDRNAELNPIERIGVLAQAGVPAALIHGDVDRVVPLAENSARFVRQYADAGAGSLVQLIVLRGQGHNFFEGFFRSQELVDFAITQARAGAK
jgi:hypothetical protein